MVKIDRLNVKRWLKDKSNGFKQLNIGENNKVLGENSAAIGCKGSIIPQNVKNAVVMADNTTGEEDTLTVQNLKVLGTSEGTGTNVITYTKVFSPDEIYDLINANYTMIAAPGVGKAIKLLNGIYEMKYGTSAYASGEGGTIGVFIYDSEYMVIGNIEIDTIVYKTFTSAEHIRLVENEAIVLTQSELTDDNSGDSPIRITLQYEIIDVFNF